MSWSDTFKKDVRLDYINEIFGSSVAAADAIRALAEDKSFKQNKYGLSNTERVQILFEFIYFYLHLTDRLAFGHMDEERRATFMTELEQICISSTVNAICHEWPEDSKERIKKECMENFRASMEEYSRYQELVPKEKEGRENTLCGSLERTSQS